MVISTGVRVRLHLLGVLGVLGLAFAACGDDTTPAGPDAGVRAEAGADGTPGDRGTTDAPLPDATAAPPTATVAQGKLEGVIQGKARAFLGIPYAAPPTGALRFKAPAAPKAWTGVRRAAAFGASCIQKTSMSMGLKDFSEDCLTLNVWTPHPAPAKPAPVMVWIHGGGFISGGAALATYDGRHLAGEQGVVVVTINYRLGPLGFLAHPKVEGGTVTNVGIRDQQAALTWVKQNIAAFEGDPKRVTLFGESAGAFAVGVHLASPLSAGLFHRAVMQSGAPPFNLETLAAAQKTAEALAKKLGCDTAADVAACLRAADARKVFDALPSKEAVVVGTGVSWMPVIDGQVLSAQPMTVVRDGKHNDVPVLMGTNKDEGTLFPFISSSTKMTEATYKAFAASLLGPAAPLALAQYPVSAYKADGLFSAAALAFADFIGDLAFICPTRLTARALSKQNRAAYIYHFTVAPSGDPLRFLGAYHSAEIPLVFGTAASLTDGESKLSAAMMAYWARLAADGDPNTTAGSTLAWTRFDTTQDNHLELGLTLKAGTGLHKKKCDFWEPILAAMK